MHFSPFLPSLRCKSALKVSKQTLIQSASGHYARKYELSIAQHTFFVQFLRDSKLALSLEAEIITAELLLFVVQIFTFWNLRCIHVSVWWLRSPAASRLLALLESLHGHLKWRSGPHFGFILWWMWDTKRGSAKNGQRYRDGRNVVGYDGDGSLTLTSCWTTSTISTMCECLNECI